MTVKPLKSYFTEPLNPGSTDAIKNTATLQAALDRACQESRSATEDLTVTYEPGVYLIDRTLTIRDPQGLTIAGAEDGTTCLQMATDTGGLDPQEARTRGHYSVKGGRKLTLSSHTLAGTHPDTGPNRSPDRTAEEQRAAAAEWKLPVSAIPKRDIWEAQHGIWLRSTEDVTLCRMKIRNVWGDFIYCGADDPGDFQPVRDLTIISCEGRRNGRIAVCMNGVVRASITGNTWDRVTSSVYHNESGQSGADHDPNKATTDIAIDGDQIGSHNNTLTVGGAGPCERWSLRNLLCSSWFRVFADGSPRLPGPTCRYRSFSFDNIRWAKPTESDYFVKAVAVDGVRLDRMYGPKKAGISDAKAMQFVNCVNVDVSPETVVLT